jgi:uncharacterized iron-regulated protein
MSRVRVAGLLLAGALSILLGACGTAGPPTPIASGAIWSTSEKRFVSYHELLGRIAAADVVFLGEIHDDPQDHSNQLKVLSDLIADGKSPVVAMEQFDREGQKPLDKARRERPTDARFAAEAAGFDFKGWDWSMYGPIVDRTLAAGLPLIAANLSREEASRVVHNGIEIVDPGRRAQLGLDRPLPYRAMRELERAISEGHCGRLSPSMIDRMVEAQRFRDAVMSDAVLPYAERGVLVIAGRGHARRDFGVPFYITARNPRIRIVSIGMFEIDAAGRPMSGEGRAAADVFDFAWFAPYTPREDTCASTAAVHISGK